MKHIKLFENYSDDRPSISIEGNKWEYDPKSLDAKITSVEGANKYLEREFASNGNFLKFESGEEKGLHYIIKRSATGNSEYKDWFAEHESGYWVHLD